MSKLPSVISEKVKESGIAITKAEKIASGYTEFVLAAQEQANKLKALQKGNKDDVAIDQAKFEAEQKAKEPVADQLIEWINSAKISKPPFEDELTAEIIKQLSNWKQWAIKKVKSKSK